jgi:hypothetical protein
MNVELSDRTIYIFHIPVVFKLLINISIGKQLGKFWGNVLSLSPLHSPAFVQFLCERLQSVFLVRVKDCQYVYASGTTNRFNNHAPLSGQ